MIDMNELARIYKEWCIKTTGNYILMDDNMGELLKAIWEAGYDQGYDSGSESSKYDYEYLDYE